MKRTDMISIFFAALMLVLGAASCMKADADVGPGPVEEGRMIEVPLSISADMMGASPDSRATSPYIPDYENLIYDIWVVQYSSRGVLLSSTVKHYRADAAGTLRVTDEPVMLRESAEDCTVCLLVNMGDDPLLGGAWPDNLSNYRNTMVPVSMKETADGGLKMPMSGFYQGPVPPVADNVTDSDASEGGYKGGLNVSLGRMMCRLNIVLHNALTTEGYTEITRLDVELQNIPANAHLLPTVNYVKPDRSVLGTVSESVETSLQSGDSFTFYYYIAPNLYMYEEGGTDFRTKLKVNAAITNLGERSGTMILGDTRPDASVRDYRLYPNNNYTFTINLTNLK